MIDCVIFSHRLTETTPTTVAEYSIGRAEQEQKRTDYLHPRCAQVGCQHGILFVH